MINIIVDVLLVAVVAYLAYDLFQTKSRVSVVEKKTKDLVVDE